MSRLIIRLSDGDRVFELRGTSVAIGRAEENDLRILDPGSSRHHCTIESVADGWRVVDLGSRNGTIVNGKKVPSKVLEPGDEIAIGETRIYFEQVPEGALPGPIGVAGAAAAVKAQDDRTLENSLDRLPRGRAGRTPIEETPAGAEPPVSPAARSAVPPPSPPASAPPGAAPGPLRVVPPLEASELEKYRLLLEINKAINSELDTKRLLERILDAAIAVTGAERGFLLLLEQGGLRVRASRNADREAVRRAEAKVSRSVLRHVLEGAGVLRVDDAGRDGRFQAADSVVDLSLAAILAAPLKARDRVIGVIYLDNRFREEAFTEAHAALLEVVADQAAIAVENARLFEENLEKQRALERAQNDLEELNRALRATVESQRVELDEVRGILEERRREYRFKHSYDGIVTRSPKMLEVFAVVDRVTDSAVPVLIQGESGTGKELIARALHFNGPRRARPFVAQNCKAIPASLMESEFFGHVRGAFTGAEREKVGLFEVADGGTIFLDEIGEMDVEMQAKLLRVLQGGELRRVGAKEFKKVDVRVVSATNQDLHALIRQGRFREDLYYRIAVINIHLPPLRDRREDIPLLVEHFLERARKRADRRLRKEISKEAMRLVMRYNWPGNVRELENEIERAYTLSEARIEVEHFSQQVREGPSRLPASQTVQRMQLETLELRELVARAQEEVEQLAIGEALRRTGWKKVQAAALLGISRPTLDSKIEKYGLRRA